MWDANRCIILKNRDNTLQKRQMLTRPTPNGMPNNFEQPKHEMALKRD